MNVLAIVSPGLKVLFERVGKPEVINRPEVLRLSGTAAVIACNHIGWVDSLWVAYAVYPRQLRYMSKQELFNSRVAKWILEQGGSFAVDREVPSRDSIKTALDLLKNGEILLIFPSGTRNDQSISFKRGAAMVALHAGVPLVPAFYQGPNDVRIAHLVQRPRAGRGAIKIFRLSVVPPWSRFTPAFHLFLPSIKVLMTCGSRTSCSVRGSG